ncbi:MAG: hypothetical protein KDC57_22460 [Saprospiraceae bacterium]|nr:hypothetical protein [Saprospiraceae bacterium]
MMKTNRFNRRNFIKNTALCSLALACANMSVDVAMDLDAYLELSGASFLPDGLAVFGMVTCTDSVV